MDGDKDIDVLFTNGDSFDRGPKPHHSVQWLENTGSYPYKHHHLCVMPGVLSARAGDFDGDGDQDVVAASLLGKTAGEDVGAMDSSAVIVLLQQKPGEFTVSKVEGRTHQHISVEVGDFDGDSHVDFAVGNFLRGSVDPNQPDVVIYWNRP